MSRFFLSTLNFVSERDLDEIVQVRSPEPSLITSVVITSRVWGSAQVDFMLGSELCSRKEHTHRMIEVPAAWADSETILPNSRG